MVAPTVISTFAGCGGSSLGYRLAGYRELLAVEWDDNAAATFQLNFPGVPVFHGDIGKLSAQQCMDLSGVGYRQLDVFDGSPPCQGFSTSGKRQFNDPRNGLFKEYARLINELQPKVFVMENVTGMIKGHMKQAYLRIVESLRDCGYRVRGEVLNAMYFNVPQRRERVIVIGVRNDLGILPTHPKPTSKPIAADEAIQGVKRGKIENARGKLAEQMKLVKPGSNLSKVVGGAKYFSYVRCPIGRPAQTIQKSVTFGGVTMWHPTENRNLCLNELKRLGSFPDEFEFLGSYEDGVNRIGNSVPPNLMKAIALHIKSEILAKTENGIFVGYGQ